MKKSLVILSTAVLLAAGCNKLKQSAGSATGGGDFGNDQQKYSYALGQQFGKNLAALEVPLDKSTLVSSLSDALEKKPSKMDEKQMQEAMMTLRDTRMAKMKEVGDKNKDEGAKFLEKNKTAEGVKTTASGLQYKVITEGSGPKPSADDTVEVHYAGTLTDGSEFDSSYKRQAPATFPVNGVIKGWTEALQLMNAGSKWKLFIPADLAYGSMDRPGIPANSTLLFEVELLKIIKPGEGEGQGKIIPQGTPKTAPKAAPKAPAKKK